MNILLPTGHRPLAWLLRSVAALALILAMPAHATSPDKLAWVAGDLPPFIWQTKDGPQGLAYELMALMAARIGRPVEVKFYPWARAVRMAQEEGHYGVFPLARTADREAQFKWLIPLAHVNYSFFGRAGNGRAQHQYQHDLHDLNALRASRVGVLRGSPIIKNLQAENFQNLILAKDYKDLLRLLSEGIVDAAYAGEPMLRAAIADSTHRPQDFRVGASLKSAELYMASSLSLDQVEAERWLQAYRELQKEGAVSRLQQKYLLPRP